MAKKQALTAEKIVRLLETRRKELRQLGVQRIGLFGSFVKGRPGEKSDLDFLVSMREPTFDQYMDLKFLLEKMFGRRADVVLESALKPALRGIKAEARYAKGF